MSKEMGSFGGLQQCDDDVLEFSSIRVGPDLPSGENTALMVAVGTDAQVIAIRHLLRRKNGKVKVLDDSEYAQWPEDVRNAIDSLTDDVTQEARGQLTRYKSLCKDGLPDELKTAYCAVLIGSGATTYCDMGTQVLTVVQSPGLVGSVWSAFERHGVPVVDARGLSFPRVLSLALCMPQPMSQDGLERLGEPYNEYLQHHPQKVPFCTVAQFCYFMNRAGALITSCPNLDGITDESFGEMQQSFLQACQMDDERRREMEGQSEE